MCVFANSLYLWVHTRTRVWHVCLCVIMIKIIELIIVIMIVIRPLIPPSSDFEETCENPVSKAL